MSLKVSNVLQFPQSPFQYISPDGGDVDPIKSLPLLGGILSDTRYVWHAKGPCLEVRNTKKGTKVGAWTFGCILKDSNTRIVCVEEIQMPNDMLSLLAVALDCTISGGLVCIFDVFGSKVIRAIQIKEKITSLHVVDSGCEVLNLPGPLRNFDGIISVGTEGGNVFLVDICRQICEEALHSVTIRDELCPCHLILLTVKDIPKIEYYKERSVREGDHLAIHLNVVLNSSTHHFTLKGPKGDDRIFVNREEVTASALCYCSQLTSLLVGFNFGAFQLWDLTTLNLVYTSPVCEDHLPITHFALQEPADDPRAFCYIWVSYSNMELFQSGLPFAVMYSLCYESKEYHEGYGYLYQDFQSCKVRFQVELGPLEEHRTGSKIKGGTCMALQPLCKVSNNKDLYLHDAVGDILALCAISWTVWFNQTETQTYMLVFDLNQWYKEQMPDFTRWNDCSNYILKASISDLVAMAGWKGRLLLDVKLEGKSLRQFTGVQRLEEHFCPSALSFNLWALRETDVILLHNEGLQKALLNQIETAGPLCLIRPGDIYRQVIALGLTPLFTDTTPHLPVSADTQRETILNVALEHQLVSWLCKCASEWANGSFSSAGCSLDFLLNWAFERAVLLKTHCDGYCTPLFDYSHLRLDNNTSIVLNSCIRQINNLSVFYSYILNKLSGFISNLESVLEQQTSLKMVSIYFEVLQWLVNVGLLPECHLSTYPKNNSTERVGAPYPVQELTEYYNKKRAQLQMLTRETFISSDSLLFIDNLVENKCGAQLLQKQWQEDGGSGLYPPPSLQSLLRTYLIEGADIGHKHSLIIYVFLDLAMALDQTRYSSVITHLIKFPAVFKVSSSIIKITQAFWQLDHGDFTTAMEQLLDPFVLSDDLQPWHHSIAMRTLLLQNQYNFALLYMQVRKPPITDEKDVLTAISLFIANNMLDEAFYFKNQHRGNNEEKLLMHLFNECNKNDSLHVLLYRCLDTNEERAFFNYLKSVENPGSDDLQVFYYLLRSRFVEAFDAHKSSQKRKPESQGLVGQRNATKIDQIVKIFKTLLPDVNRNLVDVIRKERTNLWKEVARPTPLSVFVHNTNEQVQYKSTVIHAALAKAKHTFNDSLLLNKPKEIVTEETPFLRTPKVSRMSSRYSTPVITPKVIEINEKGDELGPSPSKRLKLMPRASTCSPTRNISISIHSKMLTPIVRRKTSLQKDDTVLSNNFNISTPQSILKSRNIVKHGDAVADSASENTLDYSGLGKTETSLRKSGLGLLPRKSLPRSLRKPHVQFDDAIRLSSSISDQSTKLSLNNTSLENASPDKSLSSKDVSLMVSSKNSSSSNTDEVFYSPNSSLNNSKSKEDEEISLEVHDVVESVEVDKKISVSEDIRNNSVITQSPKARRSYKRPFGETEPVPYSPRITRLSSNENTHLESYAVKQKPISDEDKEDLSESGTSKLELPSIRQSPRLLQKIKGRKSLSRQVLEHNTFSKSLSSPSVTDSNNSVSKETSFSKVETSILIEKSQDTLEITTKETKEEITNVSSLSANSERYSSRNSIDKKKTLEYLDSDTSAELDFSFSSPNLPECLKLSNSLVEYIKSKTSKPVFEEPSIKGDETNWEPSEVVNNLEIEPKAEESKFEPEPMEIYEDLSSGAEDIQEVLMESTRETEQSRVYAELSNYSENTSKELEKNIFEMTGVPNAHLSVQERLIRTPSPLERHSDSFYVPDTEKGFIAETSTLSVECVPESEKALLAAEQEEVIEIGSSSDEQDSVNDNTDTSVSRSSEKSDSDEDELNISYERNIHVEENSRSLIDSDDSRRSDDSIANREVRQIVIEHVEELINENEIEVDDDSNLADWVANEQQSSDENAEHSEDEVIIAEHGQLNVDNVEENVAEEVLLIELKQHLDEEENAQEINESVETIPEEGVLEEESVPKQDEVVINRREYAEIILGEVNVETEEKLSNFQSDNRTTESEHLVEARSQSTNITDFCGTTQETAATKEKSTTEQSTNTTTFAAEQEKTIQDNKENVNTEKLKVDQSTNTTLSVSGDDGTIREKQDSFVEVERPKERKMYHPKYGTMKVVEDQTTSSLSSDSTENQTVITVKADVHTPSKKIIEQPSSRRVTRRSSVLLSQTTNPDVSENIADPEKSLNMSSKEDNSACSSDQQQICTADIMREIYEKTNVHTPKKKTEEPLVRRVTRRSSAVSSQTVESVNTADSFDIMDEDNSTCPTPREKAYVTDILEDSTLGNTLDSDAFTPGMRTRRSRSMTASPSRASKSLRYSQPKLDELNQPSTSKESLRLRKTRSASVDEVVASPRRRSLRRSSVDDKSEDSVEVHKPKTRGKVASVSNLPIITEEVKDKNKPSAKSRASSVDDYATTRRLTRRQASLIKGVETPSSVTAQDESDVEKDLDVDTIDPIKLLDKEPFQGPPDPEEEKVYEPSSPSNSTASSFSKPTKRTSRSASVASDLSAAPSTPKRRAKQLSEPVSSPSPKGIRTRSRKLSENSSVTSEKSDSATPPKRARRGHTAKDAETSSAVSAPVSTRSTRSRANSTSSVKSDTLTSPKRKPRSRRLASAKSDLPEITEEKGSETGNSGEKSTAKRSMRKKSSQ